MLDLHDEKSDEGFTDCEEILSNLFNMSDPIYIIYKPSYAYMK